MNMEEIYEKILWEGYGLRCKQSTRTRTGLVCRTDQGLRELKKPRGSRESLCLAFDVKEQLRQNDFRGVCRSYLTLEGLPYFRHDGILYAVEDVMPAAVWEEKDGAAFAKGAEVLGQMHRAARGLWSAAARWETDRLPKLYAKRRGELAKVRHRNDRKGSYDALDLLLLRYSDRYMERAEEAEELLRQGDYAGAVTQAAEQGGFCHNAYKGEALRLQENGQMLVGNFDKCLTELPLADLAAYLRRYLKKTDGAEAGVDAMLERYGRSCPLSQKDLTLLQGMLLYPEKFLRLVNEYYNRRRTCVSPAMQERLAAAAEEELGGERLKTFLDRRA